MCCWLIFLILGARFGNKTVYEIRNAVKESQCRKTARTQDSIWKQFTEFCEIRKFPLNKAVEMNEVASILEDYAFNANRKVICIIVFFIKVHLTSLTN